MRNRNPSEAALRAQDRRRREDSAARLSDEVPQLLTLSLELEEKRGGGTIAEAKHVRRIVIDHASSIFEIPCSDRSCRDGGHELTSTILRHLRASQPRFEGEHSCEGQIGSAPCGRILRYVCTATYRAG